MQLKLAKIYVWCIVKEYARQNGSLNSVNGLDFDNEQAVKRRAVFKM